MSSSNGPGRRATTARLAMDAGLPVVLVVALAVVFALDRPNDSAIDTESVEVVEPRRVEAAAPVRRLRLGVTPDVPAFDDMGKLLDTLGEGYQYTSFPLDDLRSAGRINEFDIVFLTCSGVPESWLEKRVGSGARPGTEVFTPNEAVLREVERSLRQFVKRGKTLYVSDLHFDLVAGAFPEFVDASKAKKGKVQDVTAEVVDRGMRELLGPELDLRFDQPDWRPAAFRGEKVTVYLRGTFVTDQGETDTAPLLVEFPFHDGTVIFTSFHNEKQNSETELKLLRYLVFSAVTAEVDTYVNKMMVQGGFSPTKKGLFTASVSDPSITQVYQCTKPGHLQFVLGFQTQGARLKLTVTGPDGRKREQEGTSTFTVDVPDAVSGPWEYTVTAIDLPNENFPFRVTVGQK